MSGAERVPKYGKKNVAFAGAELNDAGFLLVSVFAAMILGSLFGWLFYIGIPVAGLLLTKFYIQWKENNLPGRFAVILYRHGFSGYSSAFNRKHKMFVGDSKVINPSALQMGAIVRRDAPSEQVSEPAESRIEVEADRTMYNADELVS